MSTYLLINGQPISTPSKDRLERNVGPSSESLDITVGAHHSPEDFASIHLKFFARGLGLLDESLGSIVLWLKDLQDVQYQKLDGSSDVLKTLAGCD